MKEEEEDEPTPVAQAGYPPMGSTQEAGPAPIDPELLAPTQPVGTQVEDPYLSAPQESVTKDPEAASPPRKEARTHR